MNMPANPFRKKIRDRDDDFLKIKVDPRYGVPVMKVAGSVDEGHLDLFRRAVVHLENSEHIKHYMDLGRTRHLCPEAVREILQLDTRIRERGDIFDIVGMSLEAEECIRSVNTEFKPTYINA